MTDNLIHVKNKRLLDSLDSKRSILGDVAAGIAYLHSHRDRIVHRDMKPDNVLLRVVGGKIIGRAKVCELGFPGTRNKL